MKTFFRVSSTLFSVWALTACTLYKKDTTTDQQAANTAPPQDVVVEENVPPPAPDALTIMKAHPATFLFKSGASGLQPTDLSRLDAIADVLKQPD